MLLESSSNWSQGWLLTTLSSILCILGTLIIFFDDIYYFILPKSFTSKYPFHLKENYRFMNGSLGFLSGCLIITSLYRLLPEAMNYIEHSIDKSESESNDNSKLKKVQFHLILSYIAGIIICVLFNVILHYFTSESVVHCNHGGDVNVKDNHPHTHEEEEEYDIPQLDYFNQHHNHITDDQIETTESSSPKCKCLNDNTLQESPTTTNKKKKSVTSTTPEPLTTTEIEERARLDESTPLIRKPSLKTKTSLLRYIMATSSDCCSDGECKGYSSAELCTFHCSHQNHHEPDCNPLTHHHHHHLHYCEIPEFDSYQGIIKGDTSSHSSNSNNNHNGTTAALSTANMTTTVSLSRRMTHETHEVDHHHHVNSPLSRLLLIGIETVLAITLHKFPEGFVTFITSETDPELGLSIFLSLIFHNFTEGFSMCLPLYYSFSSQRHNPHWAKLKAVSISGFLGGMSQPIGALMGYFFLMYNQDKYGGNKPIDIQMLNYIFGITLALTSGFLTVIALSMYGSAVSFGGSLNFVMTWCIFGIIVISLSSLL